MSVAMRPRHLLKQLQEHSKNKDITLLIGARQTGKTTLLKQITEFLENQGKPTFFFTLEDQQIRSDFDNHPKNLFQYIPLPTERDRIYIIIDEIQYLKDPSNFLKLIYDEYVSQVKLIVSGSSSFYIDQKFRDSLAGRKKIFHLPTMGFKEFIDFRSGSRKNDYVHSGTLPKLYKPELMALFAEYLLFGGYPKVVVADSIEAKKEVLKELGESYIKKDIEEAEIRMNDRYLNILKILSKQIGQLLNINSLSNDLRVEFHTVNAYLHVMQKSFHIGLINPFYRSVATELRKMKKVYFLDLGLRNYFAGDFSPVITREDKGELLENYVYRLFSDYYDPDWDIRYWRTQKKQEVDFIIQEKKGYEIKFSKKLFKPYKYKFFLKKYPDIPLNLLTYDNILEFNPLESEETI
ncbi:MAG: ATP-binding protein [Fidelibacterota bacterium]